MSQRCATRSIHPQIIAFLDTRRNLASYYSFSIALNAACYCQLAELEQRVSDQIFSRNINATNTWTLGDKLSS